jgi:radical SAM superfamily enzyme YgiQ (UPF0313 family)
MKTLLLGINSKYIHTNLAIRLLKANCSVEVDIKEFTIKDEYETIIDYIISNEYEFVGFSCYIWNIEYIKTLIPLLKARTNHIYILFGGPEVSYNSHYYLDQGMVDFVIRNEGEVAFDMLLKALINKQGFDNIPNLSYKNIDNPSKDVDVTSLKSAYRLENDYPNRIMYVETSRGCPFSCSYCMASLEKKVRYFNQAEVKEELIYLMEKGTKVFKFLDRTFNTDINKAIDIFDFIIENHLPNTSFQFEITGDILPQDIIEHLNQNAPKNLFRFEIGIQSTNDLTNKLVNRHQNKNKLFDNISKIQAGNIIDLHLDLIAGLPKEDLKSFERTFNDVMSLRPLELQLGFLKMLRGTKIYDEYHLYNYQFNPKAPYEIISNDSLSPQDIQDIKVVENILEKYYNSSFMPKTIHYLLDNQDSSFYFFLEFGRYYESLYSWFNYNLDDLYVRLYEYLNKINFSNLEYVLFLMKFDYLSYYNIRPKIWWPRISKAEKNEIIKSLHQDSLSMFSLQDLYKYALIETYQKQYLIAIYMPNQKKVFII